MFGVQGWGSRVWGLGFMGVECRGQDQPVESEGGDSDYDEGEADFKVACLFFLLREHSQAQTILCSQVTILKLTL